MRSRVRYPRRRRRPAYYEVYAECGTCKHRQLIATFNSRVEARAWVRSRPKRARQTLTIDREW